MDLRIVRDGLSHRSRSEIRWGEGVQTSGTWIQTGSYVAEWGSSVTSLVRLIAPTAPRQLFAIKFDPEAAGLFGAEEFRDRDNMSADLINLGFEMLAGQGPVASLRALGGGRFEASFRADVQGTGLHCDDFVTIDESRGFAIEGRRYTVGFPEGSAGSADHPIDGEIRVDWAKKNDLWLPSRLREIRRSGLSTIDLSFDWISVNSPIRDDEFDFATIGAPRGTTVVDERLGSEKPVILGFIGDAIRVPEVVLPTSSLRPSTIALIALGACLSALAVYGSVRAWRRAA